MITHDVDEAVLLSDRIVMMTNGPAARIGEVLEVPLARPRKRLELAADPTYMNCRQRVLEFLYARHADAAAAGGRVGGRSHGAAQRLVIVGNGMAGLRFLEETARARARARFDITVVGAEPEPAYNRVLLSSLLAGEVAPADVDAASRATGTRTTASTLLTGQAVRSPSIRDGRSVSCATGRRCPSTSSCSRPAPSRSACRCRAAICRASPPSATLGDIAASSSGVAAAQPAVVIGGGLLGIEAAYGLARRGVAVTLVHLMDRLMERQLDAEGGALLAEAIEAKGVRVLLRAQTPRAILGRREVEAVELKDGRILPCGLVVMAVGIRRAVALARAAASASTAASSSTMRMQTSLAGIYAIGECAEHRGVCYGLVEPCYEQANVAAGAIAGETHAAIGVPCSPPISRSPACRSSPPAISRRGRRGHHRARCRRAAPTASSCMRDGRLSGRGAGRRYRRRLLVSRS